MREIFNYSLKEIAKSFQDRMTHLRENFTGVKDRNKAEELELI